jgi:hypothetical protein
MALLDAVREFLSGRDAAAQSDSRAAPPPHEAVGDGHAPFAGYEGLDDREVMDQLSGHSQTELDRVEDYERAHKDRKSVLDKLRYMRGHEPLPGYDELTAEEVVAAIGGADRAAIKRIRAYERKFANRRAVLEEVGRAMHERKTSEPAEPPPGYMPMSSENA